MQLNESVPFVFDRGTHCCRLFTSTCITACTSPKKIIKKITNKKDLLQHVWDCEVVVSSDAF
eukprot:m.142366 g.142366  ORF g.142366 m.142366 type:complete len:62 (+) comp30247_c0_seq1:1121-1306(+)